MKLRFLLIACLTLSVAGVKAQDFESPEEAEDMFRLLPPDLIKMIAEYSGLGAISLTRVNKRTHGIVTAKTKVYTIEGECTEYEGPSLYDKIKAEVWYNDEIVKRERDLAIKDNREPKYLERYSKDFFTALRKFVEKSSLDNPQAGKISPEELRKKRIKLAQTLLALTYGYNCAGWVAMNPPWKPEQSIREKKIECARWEVGQNSAGGLVNRAVFDDEFCVLCDPSVGRDILDAVWDATSNAILNASRGDTGEHDSKSIEKAGQVAFRAAEAEAYQIIAKDADSFIVRLAEKIGNELQTSEGAHAIFEGRESFNEFRLKNIQDLKEGSRHFVEPVFDMIEELLFSNSASK